MATTFQLREPLIIFQISSSNTAYTELQFCVIILYATGSKFWRGSKIVRAITEAKFLKRERLRGGDTGVGLSGL